MQSDGPPTRNGSIDRCMAKVPCYCHCKRLIEIDYGTGSEKLWDIRDSDFNRLIPSFLAAARPTKGSFGVSLCS
jgi:hypothetical protein